MLDYTSEIRIARSAKVDGEPVGSPALLSLQPGKGSMLRFHFSIPEMPIGRERHGFLQVPVMV